MNGSLKIKTRSTSHSKIGNHWISSNARASQTCSAISRAEEKFANIKNRNPHEMK
jgi:hypothetical protein